jgi:hypothetical protein
MGATVPKYSGAMVLPLGLSGTKSNIQINWMLPESPIFRFSRVGIFALWYVNSKRFRALNHSRSIAGECFALRRVIPSTW